MRLLAVSHSYPRFDGDLAGAFLERLYVALVTRGHAVRVLVPADEGRGGEGEHGGIVVERVRYATPARETLAYRGTMTQVARTPAGALAFRGMVRALGRAVAARAADADAVHANWWLPAGLAVRRAAAARARPYVLTLHGTDAALLQRSRAARWIARPVLRDAAAVTTVSQFIAGIAQRAGTRIRPTVLPMPVAIPPVPGADAGGGGVVTVGRLTRQKRVHLLVEAVHALHARGRPIRLTIVGDGPERGALEHLVRRRGLEPHVRFVGAVAPPAVAAWLAGADVFALPARHEGFGLAAAEALMAGVPIVVTNDGGGLLDVAAVGPGAARVASATAPAIAAALTDALDDRAARGDAARAGEGWRERLRPEAVAERFEEVLEGACGRT